MARKIIKQDECCVYWLFDETCSVPENDGYVGITTNLPQRLREHKSKGMRFWTDFCILFIGTEKECLEKEIGYRPYPGIGWNVNSGGTSNKMLSESVRLKISINQIGRRVSEITKQKMREAHSNRSFELRTLYGLLALGNKSRTGQTASPETRTKQSAAKIGNKNAVGNKNRLGSHPTEETRLKLSRAKKGNRYRIGKKHSDETKAKISVSQKLRLAKLIGG